MWLLLWFLLQERTSFPPVVYQEFLFTEEQYFIPCVDRAQLRFVDINLGFFGFRLS